MADRTFESASIARRRLEEEFDRSVPSRTSGLAAWLSIGGLFGSVFVVCGGLGAFLGGRDLILQSRGEGLSPQPAAVVEAPAPEPSAPVEEAPDEVEPEAGPEPEPEEAPAAEVAPAPAPKPRPKPEPLAPREVPVPEPAADDDFEVEETDLIDPWSE